MPFGSVEKSRTWTRPQDAKAKIKYASHHDPIKARALEIVEFTLIEGRVAGHKEDWKFTKEDSKIQPKPKDMWDE